MVDMRADSCCSQASMVPPRKPASLKQPETLSGGPQLPRRITFPFLCLWKFMLYLAAPKKMRNISQVTQRYPDESTPDSTQELYDCSRLY